jgi:hypothetical protein
MPSILPGSFYNPARGGHAPGDVRDAFASAIEAYDVWRFGAPEPTVELRDRQVPISRICGLLWNCSDTLPNLWCRYFEEWGELAPGSYAGAARLLRLLIARRTV